VANPSSGAGAYGSHDAWVLRRLSSNHLGNKRIPASVANQRRRAQLACGRVCRLRVRTLGPTDRRPRPADALAAFPIVAILLNCMRRLVLVIVFGFGLAVSATHIQTISDRLADSSRKPGTPLVIGTLGEPVPLSIEELTKRSDMVVEARLALLKTYINDRDTAVITDYAIQPIRILTGAVSGAARQPGIATPLVLSVYGGEVVRNGVTIRAVNHNLEPLIIGETYLLFLKHFGNEPGRYDIYNTGVFELSENTLRPLTHHRELYRDFSKTYGDVVARVMAAASPR
jgi:hypothetical protein